MLSGLRNRRLSFETCEGRRMMAAAPIVVEAEAMTLVGFRTHDKSNIAGQYISCRTDNFGSATALIVTEAGAYRLGITVKATASDKNELAFSIDGGPRTNWTFPLANAWRQSVWPAPFALTAATAFARSSSV